MKKGYWLIVTLAILWTSYKAYKYINRPLHSNPVAITLEELALHDGVQKDTVYLSFQGYVFDVSSVNHYKKGLGAYHAFAARECSIALVRGQFEDQYMNQLIEGKDEKEKAELDHWLEFYVNKYEMVGYLKGWRTYQNALRVTKGYRREEEDTEIAAPISRPSSQNEDSTQEDT
jgi:Cytochrome b5-like Heme/Steroid binding domain